MAHGKSAEKAQSRKAMRQGWGFPILSKKAHYFVDGRSLCQKWIFTGEYEQETEKRSPDDCAVCRRKLDKFKTPNTDLHRLISKGGEN
jgi:hypothetical protein